MLEYVGQINLDNGYVCIADPYYEYLDSEYAIWDVHIVPGKYNCYVKYSEDVTLDISSIIEFMYIVHEQYEHKDIDFSETDSRLLGLPSERLGFFRSSIYYDTDYYLDYFDSECYEITLKKYVGILSDDRGIVCTFGTKTTGKLDYSLVNEGKIALKIYPASASTELDFFNALENEISPDSDIWSEGLDFGI